MKTTGWTSTSAVVVFLASGFIACGDPPAPPSQQPGDDFGVGEPTTGSCDIDADIVPADADCLVDDIAMDQVGDVAATGATVEGTFGQPAGTPPEDHGFCWTRGDVPTVDDNCISLGELADGYTVDQYIVGLEVGVLYQVRGFVSDEETVQYSHNSIEFSTDAPPVTDLTATRGTNTDGVEIEWTGTDAATEYRIRRDGEELTSVNADETSYLDTDVTKPDLAGPPRDVTTDSVGTASFLEVSWEPPGIDDNHRHDYSVVAVYPDVEAPESGPVEGFRGSADLVGYAVEVDGFSWNSVGTDLRYRDYDAASATIDPGVAHATRGDYEDRVELSVAGSDTTPGEPSTYRVRAIYTDGSEEIAEPVEGRMTAGTLSFQWQRSETDQVTLFNDLPGATQMLHTDEDAPADGSPRYYRVVVDADGALEQTTDIVTGYRAAAPELETHDPPVVGSRYVGLEGHFLTPGAPPAKDHGFCIDTAAAPQLGDANCKSLGEPEHDQFSTGITGLNEETTYYVRAFATHESLGTIYGNEVTFSTSAEQCEAATLNGSLCLPDDSPWPGAEVIVSGTDCEGDTFVRTAVTDRNGDYQIDDIPAGVHHLTAQSGSFETTGNEIFVAENTENTTDPICLENDGPSIAVLQGTWDDITGLLDDVQIEHDFFSGATAVEELLADKDAMTEYDIIAAEAGAPFLDSPEFDAESDTYLDNLRNFIEDGHSLYVTDIADSYLEEAFPDAVTFHENSLTGNQTSEAVSSSALMGQILGDESLDIQFSMAGGPVIEGVDDDTTVHLSGDVETSTGSTVPDSPLMVVYDHSPGGQVGLTTFINEVNYETFPLWFFQM